MSEKYLFAFVTPTVDSLLSVAPVDRHTFVMGMRYRIARAADQNALIEFIFDERERPKKIHVIYNARPADPRVVRVVTARLSLFKNKAPITTEIQERGSSSGRHSAVRPPSNRPSSIKPPSGRR